MTDQEILNVLELDDIEIISEKLPNDLVIKKHILYMAHGNSEINSLYGLSSDGINVGSEGAACCEAAVCLGFGCDIEA